MRYPFYVILMALTMFYQGKNSFRNIALILRTAMNVQVSHTIISNWCTRFDPMFLFFLQLRPPSFRLKQPYPRPSAPDFNCLKSVSVSFCSLHSDIR